MRRKSIRGCRFLRIVRSADHPGGALRRSGRFSRQVPGKEKREKVPDSCRRAAGHCHRRSRLAVPEHRLGRHGQPGQSLYAEGRAGTGSSDRHLEIRDTRVITIAPNDIEFWDGITCVVEFSLYSNYFGSAPYYSNAMSYDSVVFYADGSCEVRSANPFRQYSARTYSYDYSGIISGIYELGTQYNQTFSF